MRFEDMKYEVRNAYITLCDYVNEHPYFDEKAESAREALEHFEEVIEALDSVEED